MRVRLLAYTSRNWTAFVSFQIIYLCSLIFHLLNICCHLVQKKCLSKTTNRPIVVLFLDCLAIHFVIPTFFLFSVFFWPSHLTMKKSHHITQCPPTDSRAHIVFCFFSFCILHPSIILIVLPFADRLRAFLSALFSKAAKGSRYQQSE